MVKADRQLDPAQQTTVITISNRLGTMDDAVKQAQSAWAKWRSGERFAPQKENLKHFLHMLMTSAKATLSFVDKLP